MLSFHRQLVMPSQSTYPVCTLGKATGSAIPSVSSELHHQGCRADG
jgi:hypothetical protein